MALGTHPGRGRGSLRFLLYSHDGCGLGHVRRNLAIAGALHEAAPEASILLATGADAVVSDWLPPNVDTLKLPSLRKVANEHYASRRLPITGSEVGALRRSLLETAAESFRPDVIMADRHPLGVDRELEAALDMVRSSGGQAVLGLRDVLDDPGRVRREWAHERFEKEIAERYRLVLLFGQRTVLDPVREYGLSPDVARRMRFCGYVLNDTRGGTASAGRVAGRRRPPRVIATAGGGEDGFQVLDGFIEAARSASWAGTAVAGPLCGDRDRDALRRAADAAGVAFRGFVPDLSATLKEVDALVCMGGYNTLAEAVSGGTPTVCIPRVKPRSEQLIRARAFSGLGLLRVIEPRALTPTLLREEIDAAMASPRAELARRAGRLLDLHGARRAAGHLLELASETRPLAAA